MEEVEYKYICSKCNYKTNIKSSYDKHIKSILHITGKRKARCDKKKDIYICDKCEYRSTNEYNYKCHYLNNHSSIDEKKRGFKYYCEKCNFGTFIKYCYNLHLNTLKHKIKAK